jgi:hypothetical protein
MKRNQFYSRIIRLLLETMFFYVLGVFAGNYISNNDVFIKLDKMKVSQAVEERHIDINITKHLDLFTMSESYTQREVQAIVAPEMNATAKEGTYFKTKSLYAKAFRAHAPVLNRQIGIPPRSDRIINTS